MPKATDRRQGWLKDLKVGDQVAVEGRGNAYSGFRYLPGHNIEIKRVVHITPGGQIHVELNEHAVSKFHPHGIRVGEYYSPRLVEITEKVVFEIKKYRSMRKAQALLQKFSLVDMVLGLNEEEVLQINQLLEKARIRIETAKTKVETPEPQEPEEIQ